MANDNDEGRLRSTPQEHLELNPGDHDSSGNQDVSSMKIDTSELFEQALEQTRMAISITNPFREDNPITYVNQAFIELTGYEREDVIGKNCRFLQGPDTDPAAVDQIRAALEEREVRVIELLNYRKDGSTFWNALHVGPVFDDDGNLTHFYGSQWDITDVVKKRERLEMQAQVAEELQHRTGNLFGVIGSILRITARNETDVQSLVEKVEGRLNALSRAHEISIREGRRPGEASDLRDLITTILAPYQTSDAARVTLDGEKVHIQRQAVTPLGLMLHELATNSLKYGAFSAAAGRVKVEWSRKGDDLTLTWIEEGGPTAQAPEKSGTGSRITEGVLRAIGAELNYDWPPSGLHARLTMPLQSD